MESQRKGKERKYHRLDVHNISWGSLELQSSCIAAILSARLLKWLRCRPFNIRICWYLSRTSLSSSTCQHHWANSSSPDTSGEDSPLLMTRLMESTPTLLSSALFFRACSAARVCDAWCPLLGMFQATKPFLTRED